MLGFGWGDGAGNSRLVAERRRNEWNPGPGARETGQEETASRIVADEPNDPQRVQRKENEERGKEIARGTRGTQKNVPLGRRG